MPKQYAIPGFSSYVVMVNPFRVISQRRGPARVLKSAKRRILQSPSYYLVDDHGNARCLTQIRIAALAFHGLPPRGYIAYHAGGDYLPSRGYIAYHAGGDYLPSTIFWMPKTKARRLSAQKLTEWQRFDLLEQFYRPTDGPIGDHIAELASRFNVSVATIYNYVQRAYRDRSVPHAT